MSHKEGSSPTPSSTPRHALHPHAHAHPHANQELYRAAKARFDEDEDFKLRARQAVTELQGGRPEYVAAWKRICAASRREFEAIYSRLGVELQERGESFYNPALKGLVAELEGQGIAEESDGCSVVFVEVCAGVDGGWGCQGGAGWTARLSCVLRMDHVSLAYVCTTA